MENHPSSLRTLRRTLALGLVSTATIAVVSCQTSTDESTAPEGASPEAARENAPPTAGELAHDTQIAAALQSAFPKHAKRALGLDRPLGFVARDGGFRRPASESSMAHMDVELPGDGSGVARITAPGGFEVLVREIGAHGQAAIAGRAVAYKRAGGTSFWTVTSGGAEEWLHLTAGAVASKDEPAASWEVEGASLAAMNGAVALMDDSGVARGWVTAPAAFGKDGRAVDLRLAVSGDRIDLFADARGEEVLIDPGWQAVAPVATGRYGATGLVLPSGKVLFSHGFNGLFPAVAEQYDPPTNVWSTAGTPTAGRYLPGAVLLGTGRVLVVGGQGALGNLSSTELYNPATNTWAAGPAMSSARAVPNVALLPNGKVLVTGGYDGVNFLFTAQTYDPATNTWSVAAAAPTARGFASVVVLPSGKVLFAGGINGNVNTPTVLSVAELYDPVTNTWSSASRREQRFIPLGFCVFLACIHAVVMGCDN